MQRTAFVCIQQERRVIGVCVSHHFRFHLFTNHSLFGWGAYVLEYVLKYNVLSLAFIVWSSYRLCLAHLSVCTSVRYGLLLENRKA